MVLKTGKVCENNFRPQICNIFVSCLDLMCTCVCVPFWKWRLAFKCTSSFSPSPLFFPHPLSASSSLLSSLLSCFFSNFSSSLSLPSSFPLPLPSLFFQSPPSLLLFLFSLPSFSPPFPPFLLLPLVAYLLCIQSPTTAES